MLSDKTLHRLLGSDPLVALLGDLIRTLMNTAVALLVSLWLAFYFYQAHRMYTQLHMNDFGRFYYSARAFLDGADMYGPTVATPIQVGPITVHLWNMNPPHFHLLLLPLALLSPLQSLVGWWLLGGASLVFSLTLVARELGLTWTWRRVLWTAAGIVLTSATGIIVVTGQVTFVLMLPITLAWVEARRGRWTRAGIWLGVSAGLKPFLGLFVLYLLLTHRFKAAAVMITSVVLSFAAGLAVFGWPALQHWIGVLREVDWGFAPMNASLPGLFSRTFSANPIFVPLIQAPALVRSLSAILGLAIGATTLLTFTRDTSGDAVDRAFAAVLLCALLVSPLGWMYYLWWAAGPLAALWLSRSARPSLIRDAFVVMAVPGLLLPLYVTTTLSDRGAGSITLGSTYAWTVLALWLAVMLDWLAREPRTT